MTDIAHGRIPRIRRTIEAAGMRFVPDEVHVRAGQPVTLPVVNWDGYAHAFDMDEFEVEP